MQWSRSLLDRTGLLVIAVVFLLAVAVNSQLPGHWRLDLTENKLYTLSDGTKAILGSIEEPLYLNFVFSESSTTNFPALRSYANRITDILFEFQRYTGGQLHVNVIHPQPFSEDEDQANLWGLQAITLGGPDPVYLGVAGTNSVDGLETIPFFDPSREAFLEYDLTSLISRLNRKDKPLVSVLSGIPDFDPASYTRTQPPVIFSRIADSYNVLSISPDATELNSDTDVLLLIQPPVLLPQLEHAIEQYLAKGGAAIVFLDPYVESQPDAPAVVPGFLRKAGIRFTTGQFVADERYALQITADNGGRPLRHPALLGLRNDAINGDEPVSANLESINVSFAGAFSVTGESGLQLLPLLNSPSGALLPLEALTGSQNPQQLYGLLDSPQFAMEQPLLIAARVTGNAELNQSPGNLVLIADTDLLNNHYWVQQNSVFGQDMQTPFAGNGDFILNLIDNMAGSEHLIGIRSRPAFSRPFHRVDELRRIAEQRFRTTERELQMRLLETENRLQELKANETAQAPQFEQEVERFLSERLRIRKELRQVRRNLDKDIEQLGAWLKLINIAAIPVLLTLIALLFTALHKRRK